MATKIGVYFDQQNIGGGLDLAALAEGVGKKWGAFAPVVKVCPALAEAATDIQADIDANGLDGVLICGTSPRSDWDIYRFPNVQLERVNLREQCVMAFKNPDGAASASGAAPPLLTLMAQDYVNMGVVKLQKTNPVEPAQLERGQAVKRVLVIGGGWTGVCAALAVSAYGYEVVLVEKEKNLGGHASRMFKSTPHGFPYNDPQETGLEGKLAKVQADKSIAVYTNAVVARLEGQPGEFTAVLNTDKGEVRIEVGAVVPATGWKPMDGAFLAPLGYGVLPNVVTAGEFEQIARKGEIGARRIAFVLDVSLAVNAAKAKAAEQAAAAEAAKAAALAAPPKGAEAESGPAPFVKADLENIRHLGYSNELACLAALKQANYVCDAAESAQAYILYDHMVVQGVHERYYKAAQDRLGIMMTKATVTGVAMNENGALAVSCAGTLLGVDFDLEVDMVVLPTGIVPTTAKETVVNFAYRLGPDFPDLELFDGFADSNYICFPYESRRTGVYPAGCVRRPMTLDACEEDAQGAALKAIQCVESAGRGMAVHPRSGDMSHPVFNFVRCTQCKRCTEECPFGALDDDEKGTPKPNPARCRRCGTCFGACPERVVSFANYNIDQIGSMIREVHVPKDMKNEGPRVLILACENDAYPALDMAAMRQKTWSPYVRVIPVRCLGSLNAIWISDAMSKGYDGVMMLGCKYGGDYQCHFVKGSEICNRRKENIAETLARLGIEASRVEQLETAIDEYDKVPAMIDDFVRRIIEKGPNPFKGM
ncbi:MAG: hydrogenase iron-sulfur subunit [Deltaproteobacteria bacterium]|jgi:quinone-modifying oxidoreductase subunit QmoB|nr:hydrogenase iron-sulfur subunit [Deltaproteobacteria bacterium]